jgi:hypothetical protein
MKSGRQPLAASQKFRGNPGKCADKI